MKNRVYTILRQKPNSHKVKFKADKKEICVRLWGISINVSNINQIIVASLFMTDPAFHRRDHSAYEAVQYDYQSVFLLIDPSHSK